MKSKCEKKEYIDVLESVQVAVAKYQVTSKTGQSVLDMKTLLKREDGVSAIKKEESENA